ncbi:MAG: PD-(D/E)XK nuclease family protein [Acidobacteria bacterium]|nr:PD-(D/E)XK nuclease family protein [Acidobacteriota bacterium]
MIENKIDSGEHSEQLTRYRQIAKRSCRLAAFYCIFLTKAGDSPTDNNYIAVDYATVQRVLDRLIAKRESTLGADVLTLLTHYSQMLGRHIVEDSEIARLWRDIYKKHKQALDLIYSHRPDETAVVSERMKELIGESGEFVIDTDSKSTIRWHRDAERGKRMDAFGPNASVQLKVILYIGPGPEETRQRLFEIARPIERCLRSRRRSIPNTIQSISTN